MWGMGFPGLGGVAGGASSFGGSASQGQSPLFNALMQRSSGDQAPSGASNDRYGGTGPLSDPAPTYGQYGTGPMDSGGSPDPGITGRYAQPNQGYLPPVVYNGNFGGTPGRFGWSPAGRYGGSGWGWGSPQGQAPNQNYRAEPERQAHQDPSPYPGYAYDSNGGLTSWVVPRDNGQFSRPAMDKIESNFRSMR